jgi:hypothetical protein
MYNIFNSLKISLMQKKVILTAISNENQTLILNNMIIDGIDSVKTESKKILDTYIDDRKKD